jgi:membrane protease YdiL (CAAX protease family)
LDISIKERRAVFAGHVLPFFIWIGVIFALPGIEKLGFPSHVLYPWSYAIKSALCAVLFLWLKPWRIYSSLELRNILPALLIGCGVALIWIVPEMPVVGRVFPGFQDFYHRWLIMMPGTLPSYYPELPPDHVSWSYAPARAGWFLTVMKLFGSCCVIAVIEEFFFRGFFYRWQSHGKFWLQPLSEFDMQAFLITVAFFGLEHDRWLMGMAAGAIYGLFIIIRGDIWAAALAHGVTNFLLGLYVIMTQQYGFW